MALLDRGAQPVVLPNQEAYPVALLEHRAQWAGQSSDGTQTATALPLTLEHKCSTQPNQDPDNKHSLPLEATT